MRRLYRAVDDRMIAGVCGGLGKYFNIDPTIVRLVTVVLVLASVGGVFLAYFIGAIIIPNETDRS
ncbi:MULTISPECIES: PspC domain-containing protein [Bacillaceae]|uniref:PspC domain-containing protein n=1 Tax=Evansella alkalicola TaxID=745819 RepID=A0ABS6JUK4_9BACI|nr:MULTISPECIES: PspC domain-containing protein [Bacillaceae]MBU9722252.1 PspC domain-containing protein [Bacillus alkalicola]